MRERAKFSGRIVRRAVLLGVIVAVLVSGVVFWPWISAQARAAVVVSSVLQAPVLAPAVRTVTGEPRVEETKVAGNPASVFRPGGEGPHTALLFVNGMVPQGRKLPDVRRLAKGLARAGYVVVVPDLPGLREDRVTPQTVSETIQSARATADLPDARGGEVGLVGVSTGAALALLVAEDPSLEGRISVVAGLSPYSNIRTVLDIATTEHYRLQGKLKPYHAAPLLSYVAANSLISGLPPGEDRRMLLAKLETEGRQNPYPLHVFRELRPDGLTPKARSVVRLLANEDPERFNALYRKLPEKVRADLKQLSPLAGNERIEAPVKLATGPHDKYFPVSESRAVGRIAPDFQLTVTDALHHAKVGFSAGDVYGFARFDGFVVRSLREASR